MSSEEELVFSSVYVPQSDEEPLMITAPKKGGRPKGVKTTKQLSPADINAAKTMFVSGKTLTDIMKSMGLSSTTTLYRYMEKDNWLVERDKYLSKATDTHLDALLSQSLAETNEILLDLEEIRQKAIDAIQTGAVEPRKYSEASGAYIDSVNTTMKIRAEALQLSFISEVGKILRIRIQDPKLLSEISNDLRELFKKKQEITTIIR
jgi:hypothetical protein